MTKTNKIWGNRRWRQFWSRPSLKCSHQSAAFSWNLIKTAKARSERFVAWLQKCDYPHYGPKAKIPELFYRRDLNFFALRSGRLHFDRALRPNNCFDLLDAAARVGALEIRLGYTFKDRMLCLQALKSTASPVPLYWKGTMFELAKNNRLALLGDRVLALTVCMIWFKTGHSNKDYSDMEAKTLSRVALAETARKIRLQEALLRQTDVEDENKDRLAEGFEAVIGAVFQDSNEDLSTVKRVIQNIELGKHRNLKSWEHMTEHETKMTINKNSDPFKRQFGKGGESGIDHVSATRQGFVRPSSYAPVANVHVAQSSAQMTVEGPAQPKVHKPQQLDQVAQELAGRPRFQEVHRLVDCLPLKQRQKARLQLLHVTRMADSDNPTRMKAANLALGRYVDLLKAGNHKPGNSLQYLYQKIRAEMGVGAHGHKQVLSLADDPVHAPIMEEKQAEGPPHIGGNQKRALRAADGEPELRKDQGEDEAWDALGQAGSARIQEEDKAHETQEETKLGNVETERLKGEEMEEEEKMIMLWSERDQKSGNALSKLGRKRHQYRKRLADIRKARAQDNILSEEAQDSEDLVATEADTKARVAEEVSTRHLKSKETMLYLEEREGSKSSQAPKHTLQEELRTRNWRDMFIFGHTNASFQSIAALRIHRRAYHLDRKVSKTTLEMIQLRRPQRWPTVDELQEQVVAAITSPFKEPHYNVRSKFSRGELLPSTKYERSISKAVLQGLRLGTAEWNQYVKATFHRATKMHLVVDALDREGHVTHWKEEYPDHPQFLFIQAWESATDAGTSTEDFLRQFDDHLVDITGVRPTTELVVRAYAALERKLMNKTALSDAETTPWQEAVREAVRDQEEKQKRVVEEKQTAAKEEELMHMLKAEQACIPDAERKAKDQDAKETMAQRNLNRKMRAKENLETAHRERSRDIGLLIEHTSKRKRELKMITWWQLSFEERKAIDLGDSAIRALSVISQINIRLSRIQASVVSQTLDFIGLPDTRQCGDWARKPPVTIGELQDQSRIYCQPLSRFKERWLSIMFIQYRNILLFMIERGFRIGTQEWNDAFEAHFHLSVRVSMALRHTRFILSPQLQLEALELERHFDGHLANLRRKESLAPIPDEVVLSFKKQSYHAVLPSETYQPSEIRKRLPPNLVLTGQLRMTELAKTGTTLGGMLTSSTILPTPLSAWLEAILDVESNAVFATGCTDALPVTGTLAIVSQAEEVTNEHPEISSATATDPLMESEQARNSTEESSSLKRSPPATGTVSKSPSKGTPSGSTCPPQSPPSSDSVFKSAEPNTIAADAVSTSLIRRGAPRPKSSETAPASSRTAPASSETAPKRAQGRKRVAVPIRKCSPRGHRQPIMHKTSSRGTNQARTWSLPPEAASTKAQARGLWGTSIRRTLSTKRSSTGSPDPSPSKPPLPITRQLSGGPKVDGRRS